MEDVRKCISKAALNEYEEVYKFHFPVKHVLLNIHLVHFSAYSPLTIQIFQLVQNFGNILETLLIKCFPIGKFLSQYSFSLIDIGALN
jgi:hypothetical protein